MPFKFGHEKWVTLHVLLSNPGHGHAGLKHLADTHTSETAVASCALSYSRNCPASHGEMIVDVAGEN